MIMPVISNAADLDRVAATAAPVQAPFLVVLTQVRGGIEDAAVAATTLRTPGIPVAEARPPAASGVDLMTELTKDL